MFAVTVAVGLAPVAGHAEEWVRSSFKQVMNGRDTQKLTGIHGTGGYAASITFSLSKETAEYELPRLHVTSALETRGDGYCIHIKGSDFRDNGRSGWRCADEIQKSTTSGGTVFRFKRRGQTLYDNMAWGN